MEASVGQTSEKAHWFTKWETVWRVSPRKILFQLAASGVVISERRQDFSIVLTWAQKLTGRMTKVAPLRHPQQAFGG